MADPAEFPGPGAKGTVDVHEPLRWERAVARRSAEARAVVPDLEMTVEVDMDAVVRLCGREVGPAVARACGLALREHPRANGAYRDGRFEVFSRVNLGVVVTAEDTYVIPTLFDADTKGLDELQAELETLTGRARDGQLASPELSGGTCTLWNAGALGLSSATPLVVPPQAAAVCCGAVRSTPVVREGAVLPGEVMTLSLACDHRVLYGVRAAAFLRAIKERLESAAI